MRDQEDKEAMRRRHYRQADKQQARDENERRRKRRQKAETERRGPKRDHKTGRRDDSDELGLDPGQPGSGSRAARDSDWVGTVVGIHRGVAIVRAGGSEVTAAVRGLELAIGDHVVCRSRSSVYRVVEVEERRSTLSRPDPGNRRRERVLAANVDLAVVVISAKDPEFKPALIDRMLIALGEGGVEPLVCINKIDLCDEAERRVIEQELEPFRSLGVRCILTSADDGRGIAELRAVIKGRTCVFVGHSGVGKSSLLNRLDSGRERAVGAGRTHDGKGRHTTSSSAMVELDGGTRLIDTPGIREFGLWAIDGSRLRVVFPGFADLALQCRFGDCRHLGEPGCAVLAAVESGRFSAERFGNYQKLVSEVDST